VQREAPAASSSEALCRVLMDFPRRLFWLQAPAAVAPLVDFAPLACRMLRAVALCAVAQASARPGAQSSIADQERVARRAAKF